MAKFQVCYNGVRFLDGAGPCPNNVNRLDMGALPMISAMQNTGLQVDLDHFSRMERELADDLERITEEVRSITGHYINIDSGDQTANLLFKILGLKQARPKMTASGDRESVEDQVLTAIQHDHPVVPKLQEFKEYSKLLGTYVRPMPKLARRVASGEWRMFPNLSQSRIPSGRLNCKSPNLLAMPTRTDRGREIRKGFIAGKGRKIVSIDESQIEPRIAAHRSKDPNLLKIYRTGEDIYSDYAISAFRLQDDRYFDDAAHKWKYPHVLPMEHRRPCKTCVLAALYGVTAEGLLEQMPVICKHCKLEATKHTCGKFESLWNEAGCQDILNAFFLRYEMIVRMMKIDHATARRSAMIWDLWGRVLHVAAVRSALEWVVSAALREVGNFPLQCLSKHTAVFQRGKGLVRLGSLEGQTATLWDGREWSTGSVMITGKKEQLHLTLANGQELYCSPDHRLLIGSPKGNFHWKTAGELKISNWKNLRVCLSGAVPEWDWLTELPTISNAKRSTANHCSIQWGLRDSELFGEMLGRIASDGCLISDSRNNNPKCVYMIVAEHEKSILPRLLDAVTLTADTHRISIQVKGSHAPIHRIEIYSKDLTKTFMDWELKDRIPQVVWKKSDMLRGYLRGLFDGDGGVVGVGPKGSPKGGPAVVLTFGSGWKKIALAKDTQQALLLFGIRSRLRTYEDRIHLQIQRKDLFYFRKHIGFINKAKQDKLDSIVTFDAVTAAYGYATSIKNIESDGEAEMVDFVNSTTGRFAAEGMVVHNSSAQGTIKLVMAETYDDIMNGGLKDCVWPLLQVHDELLFEVQEDLAEEWGEHVAYRFRNCVHMDVPIEAGIAIADTWGHLPK